MKKNYYLFLLLSFAGFAQIPNGYYNSANGLNGYNLKTALYNIINNNTNSNSTANYGDLWTLYTQSAMRDNYYEADGSLLDLYSENPNGIDPYNFTSTTQQCGSSTPTSEGGCYNREHIIPQNVFGGSVYPMYSDAHFVLPSDNRVNGWRDSYPFGQVNTASIQCSNSTNDNVPCFTRNGSRLGPNTNVGYTAGYSGVVFEPIDAFKGDVARAVLYFITRYQNNLSGSGAWSYSMFNGTSDQGLTDTFLNIMIKWHQMDPPSQYEIDKNNAVYLHQGNRNPFIDNKDYVCQIWPNQCNTLSNQDFTLQDKININPNPSNGVFKIQLDETLEDITLEIYSTLGQKVFEQKDIRTQEIEINNLTQGVYLAKLSKNNQVVIKKIIVN